MDLSRQEKELLKSIEKLKSDYKDAIMHIELLNEIIDNNKSEIAKLKDLLSGYRELVTDIINNIEDLDEKRIGVYKTLLDRINE